MTSDNIITIKEPRWHDRKVLIADHRIAADNTIKILHRNYPRPIYMSGAWARQFPTEQMKIKAGGTMKMRVVPLDELLDEEVQL